MGDRGVSGGGVAYFLRLIILSFVIGGFSSQANANQTCAEWQVWVPGIQCTETDYTGYYTARAACNDIPGSGPSCTAGTTGIITYGYGNNVRLCHYICGSTSCPSGKVDDGTGKCIASPTCTPPQVLNQAGTACVDLTCTPPQVLNAARTACVGCPSGYASVLGKCEKDCVNGSAVQPSGVRVSLGSSCENQIEIEGCMYSRSGACVCAGTECIGWGVIATGLAPAGSGYSPESGTSSPPPSTVPSPVSETQCGVGECSATLNGVQTCQACQGVTTAKTPSAPETVTTTNPDGTKTRTEVVPTTTCSGGNCTTTTTETTTPIAANGTEGASSTTTKTDTQSQQNFCQQNPKALGCGGSTFSGTCTSGFACDGDPVLCAVARGEWDSNCRMTTPSVQSDLANQARLGSATAVGAGSSSVDVPSQLTAAMGSRFFTPNCIPPVHFSVRGVSFTADTTMFCNFASIAGYIFVAIASVVAVKILGA